MTSRVPTLFAGPLCSDCPASAVCTVAGSIEACGDERTEDRRSAHPQKTPELLEDDFRFPPLKLKPLPSLPAAIVIADAPMIGRLHGIRLRRALQPGVWQCAQAPKPISVLHGRDGELDRLWHRLGAAEADFRAWNVPAVVSPAFSTWWTETPFASLVAMAKTAEAARVLGQRLPVVPSVVWRFERDLDRWAAWIIEEGAEAISVDLGSLRALAGWAWGIRGIARLGELLGANCPKLLANGPSTTSRIGQVVRAWPGVVVPMSQHPWQTARNGRKLNDDLTASPAPRFDTERLTHINADVFDTAVRSLTGGPAETVAWRSSKSINDPAAA